MLLEKNQLYNKCCSFSTKQLNKNEMRSNCSEEIKLSHRTRANTTYNYIQIPTIQQGNINSISAIHSNFLGKYKREI